MDATPTVTEARPRRDLLDPRGWLALTAVALVGLGVTGWWQAQHYRPSYAQAWDDIYTLHEHADIAPPDHGLGWVSGVHRGLAVVFVAAALGLVLTLFRWCRRRGQVDLFVLVAVVLGAGAVDLALGSSHGLRWDQLALWAVTVGSDHSGIWPAAFDDQVRFVLTNGVELPQPEYASDVVRHVVVVPAMLVTAGTVLALRLRGRRAGR